MNNARHLLKVFPVLCGRIHAVYLFLYTIEVFSFQTSSFSVSVTDYWLEIALALGKIHCKSAAWMCFLAVTLQLLYILNALSHSLVI